MGMIWSAAMIKRGLQVRLPGDHAPGIVSQGSWAAGDDMDLFVILHSQEHVFMPEMMNAERMAAFLTNGGYEPWD